MKTRRSRLSVLKNPRNVRIENLVVDGRVKNANEITGDRLDKLYDKVAHNAILNANGRADDVRCYPGTREEVIGRIEDWKNRKSDYISRRMIWLSGPAGAGKTAIVQTVAEEWKKSGISAASFFFFRGDITRNNSKPIVATLLYQLFDLLPALKQSAADLLSNKPWMMEDSIQNQFLHLIDAPIRTLMQRPSFNVQAPIALLIDGFDECGSGNIGMQEQVLQALHDLVAPMDSPFIVLVASRPEPNLIMTFKKLSLTVGSILLDEEYRPEKDIRHFVVAKFDEIKRTHHLSPSLHDNWPLDTDIGNIVAKSSGQFIYAATTMRFLENSPESPDFTLKIIQGIQPARNHSPFAQLDAMYAYILSRPNDQTAIKEIFALHFISDNLTPENAGVLLSTKYDCATVESLMSVLTAIVQVVQPSSYRDLRQLEFYHASLGDFLQDESRSGIHFVDVHAARVRWHLDMVRVGNEYAASLLCESLKKASFRIPPAYQSAYSSSPSEYVARINADTIKEIYDQLWNTGINRYKRILRRWVWLMVDYKIPFPSQGVTYPFYRPYKFWIDFRLHRCWDFAYGLLERISPDYWKEHYNA